MQRSPQMAAAGLMLLILLLAGGAQAARATPSARRRLAQATAYASADARDGASVSSQSTATSHGKPTSSVVQASGSGSGVAIDCRQAAANGQQLSKECTQGRSCGQGWYDAPACSSGVKANANDAQGCPWGYENGKSCAKRS